MVMCTMLAVFICSALVICTEGNLEKSLCIVGSDADIAAFFRYYGYNIELPPISVSCITITSDKNYNNMQNQTDFNLKPFVGKSVMERTYKITGVFPAEGRQATGKVLIYGGRIIGGDVR